MVQWEYCRLSVTIWAGWRWRDEHHRQVTVCYATAAGGQHCFPVVGSWLEAAAILGAAGWQVVQMYPCQSLARTAADLDDGVQEPHCFNDRSWVYQGCLLLAYFQRPIQAGRAIDDAVFPVVWDAAEAAEDAVSACQRSDEERLPLECSPPRRKQAAWFQRRKQRKQRGRPSQGTPDGD